MAGSHFVLLPISNGDNGHHSGTTTAIGDQWAVQYSRFFNYPSPSPSAVPHPSIDIRHKGCKGTWISTSLQDASLGLVIADQSRSDSVLTVTLHRKVLIPRDPEVIYADVVQEEHCISKLHYTWPQVSCVSGYPLRGSRVLFVSYKDHLGQIQKFALRFLTIDEAERFTIFLKESLEDDKVRGPTCSNSRSELSSHSEFIPSEEPVYRPRQEWSPITSADTSAQQVAQSLSCEVSQNSVSQETAFSQDAGGSVSTFPPSFTSLLMNCCPVPQQAAAQPTASSEADLKMEITKYLEDSSFQDMLSKVQKVISEIGEDLLL